MNSVNAKSGPTSAAAGARGQQQQSFLEKHHEKVMTCATFPWLSILIVIVAIVAAIMATSPSGVVQDNLRELFDKTNWGHTINFKSEMAWAFFGIIMLNFVVTIMSFKANGWTAGCWRACGAKCYGKYHTTPCQSWFEWVLHWCFLLISYIISIAIFAGVLGFVILDAAWAFSTGICKSNVPNLDQVVNTVFQAFKAWVCEMQQKDEAYIKQYRKALLRFQSKENLCTELPASISPEDVSSWCTASEALWQPASQLVIIAAVMLFAQVTVAMIQRGNLIAFNDAAAKVALEQKQKSERLDHPRTSGIVYIVNAAAEDAPAGEA